MSWCLPLVVFPEEATAAEGSATHLPAAATTNCALYSAHAFRLCVSASLKAINKIQHQQWPAEIIAGIEAKTSILI